ncbi:hypothetical protein [Paenibacillus naphthalenovorans]|uniref:Uncharacterized protein n=1 Tax=Paenibacillus naphthalenovorans TaxID=162209 RepID=A0A0U2M3V1_9BACL|nr:hypothetical protein [Paenibacillus naphthalenovorans]ALS22128.1 hypothetical protein IJ22_17540 [Paenibacillus naphthalenovorans]
MRQIDKDLLTLGSLTVLLESTGKNIKDYVEDYDGLKIVNFAEESEIYKTDKNTEKAIVELANECYKRIKKKFPKEDNKK